MSKLPRFGSALSALALAGVIAGCAGPMSRQGAQASKADRSDVGLATRAHMALAAGDFANAIALAERAVEKDPREAIVRALLGNVYFSAGRFASAEAAYRDALSLASNQPQVILKLALVQIAQGKNNEALAFLAAARDVLEPADHGLALALAGQPQEAVAVLEPAARAVGADARVRQNLALAYGLAGDWVAARTIAAQDISPDQLDSRVHQWMAFAKPARASDQVASLVGVTPVQMDPGQPARLALNDGGTRMAQAAVPAPQPVAPAPLPVEAAYAPPAPQPAPEPPVVTPEYQAPAVAAAFEAPPAAELVTAQLPAAVAAEPAPPPPLVAALSPTVEVAPAAPKPVKAVARAKPRPAALARNGNAGVVVQLGAYSSPGRVEAAWEQFVGRYGSLRVYTPTSARFDSARGTVYRLSVKGFASAGEAGGLCSALRRQGKSCFVRRIAGDSPVRFASR